MMDNTLKEAIKLAGRVPKDITLNMGMELEGYYSKDNILDKHPDFRRGDYHAGISYIPGWSSQRDGSLRSSDDASDDDEIAIEFVSNICTSPKEMLVRVDELLDDVGGFDSVLFDDTTGAHMHFSIMREGDIMRLNKTITPPILGKTRAKFMEHMQSLIGSSRADEYGVYYGRGFSRMGLIGSLSPLNTDRRSEFNISLNDQIEWRALHLNGLRSRKEVLQTIAGAIRAINETIIPVYAGDEAQIAESGLPELEVKPESLFETVKSSASFSTWSRDKAIMAGIEESE